MNPQQFAGLALKYLDRVPTQGRQERAELAAVEQLIERIRRGELVVGEPQPAEDQPLPEQTKREP